LITLARLLLRRHKPTTTLNLFKTHFISKYQYLTNFFTNVTNVRLEYESTAIYSHARPCYSVRSAWWQTYCQLLNSGKLGLCAW